MAFRETLNIDEFEGTPTIAPHERDHRVIPQEWNQYLERKECPECGRKLSFEVSGDTLKTIKVICHHCRKAYTRDQEVTWNEWEPTTYEKRNICEITDNYCSCANYKGDCNNSSVRLEMKCDQVMLDK